MRRAMWVMHASYFRHHGGWGRDLATAYFVSSSRVFSPPWTKVAVQLALTSPARGSLVAESSRCACMPMRTRSMPVALLDEDGATRPAPRLSGNTKSLLMMFVLFTSITAAQWVGGVLAHSLALKVGC